jgi:2-methylisocitrate lyase-like PEP mutase family enzyme
MKEKPEGVSRRDFGKSMALGMVGGLVGGSAISAAKAQNSVTKVPKRMSTTLREMLNEPGIFMSPGVYDPITARIAERAGFKVLDLAGSGLGYVTTMMEPNLCLEDMAEATRGITGAVNIPLIIDAGAGFGEPAHVYHTVRVLEHAGAAGIHIEDQIYPKRFHYHVGVEHTLSPEEMIEKIQAAREGRRDPDTVICGRTDTFKTKGFAEGVKTANRYFEAGADLIMMFPGTADEVKRLPKEVIGPINWVQSFRPDQPAEIPLHELEAVGRNASGKGGYKIINYPNQVMVMAYKAVRDMLKVLHDTGSTGMDRKLYQDVTHDVWEAIDYKLWNDIESRTTEKG